MMKQPHKHAELIKAWADGAEIEAYAGSSSWVTIPSPEWYSDTKYRIKPEPKPDVVRYVKAHLSEGSFSIKATLAHEFDPKYDNLKLTFDGETEKLKTAEVL